MPPETGGILGSSAGQKIDRVIMDEPHISRGRMCSYSPNVAFLNKNIEIWQNDGIVFQGIFHTHFMNIETLSLADKEYITAIMKAMPNDVEYLYFPVFVLPKRKLISFKAVMKSENVEIYHDEIHMDF